MLTLTIEELLMLTIYKAKQTQILKMLLKLIFKYASMSVFSLGITEIEAREI